MSKEIIELIGNSVTDEEIDQLYFRTKFMLETYKEIYE